MIYLQKDEQQALSQSLHARAERDLSHLLPRFGPVLGALLVVYWTWDLLLDPQHAVQSGVTRLAFAGLAAFAFWQTAIPWSAHMRAGWAHWMLSSGVILASAQLDDGLVQGAGGIIIGVFLIPFIANGTANFVMVVLPPAVLFMACSIILCTIPELVRGMLLYGSGIAVAYVQMRITLSLRAQGLSTEAQLISEATHDALTGCYNRAWITQEASRLLVQSRRYRTDLVFAMLDIDHFKRVNDTYGHQAGDEVLKAVAEAIQDAKRESDLFGRYGGEEFFCIFPHTSREAAFQCAERIRNAVSNTAISANGTLVKVTISIGIAQLTESHRSWMELLREADEALYTAKLSGRNCVK